MFKENLFRAKLAEQNLSMVNAAKIAGCTPATLYRKVNGISDFTRDEIQRLRDGLMLSKEDVENIFFAEKLA